MSTFQTLLDSYGALANRYAELEAERDALQARVAELEAANKRLADSRDRWKAWWGMQRDTHKKHIDELTASRRY